MFWNFLSKTKFSKRTWFHSTNLRSRRCHVPLNQLSLNIVLYQWCLPKPPYGDIPFTSAIARISWCKDIPSYEKLLSIGPIVNWEIYRLLNEFILIHLCDIKRLFLFFYPIISSRKSPVVASSHRITPEQWAFLWVWGLKRGNLKYFGIRIRMVENRRVYAFFGDDFDYIYISVAYAGKNFGGGGSR